MLRGEDVMEISVLTKLGMSIREIARRTGLSRNTVRKYLRNCCEPIYGPPAPGTSKLDPYKR